MVSNYLKENNRFVERALNAQINVFQIRVTLAIVHLRERGAQFEGFLVEFDETTVPNSSFNDAHAFNGFYRAPPKIHFS